MAVLKVILGEAPDQLPPLVASESGTEVVWLVAKEQSKYWKSVDPKWCEPREGMPLSLRDEFNILKVLSQRSNHWHSQYRVRGLREKM